MRLVLRAVGAAGIAAALAVALGAGSVSAHAELISVDPSDGELLAEAPAEVVLTFSEPVSLTGGGVRVLDDDARDVATAVEQENEVVTAALPADLADGTYTVVIEVISVDSHRIGGASVFHVGAPTSEGLTGDALELGGDEAGWGIRAGGAVLTAIGYLGALVAAGTLLFSLYADRRAALGAVSSRAAVIGAVALVAAVPFRIARLGGGLDALRDNDVLMSALRGPVGVATAVTANALLIAAVLIDRRTPRWIPLAFAVVALAGFAIEGHTRAADRRWAMIASDVVHLLAGALWLGGIVALVVAFRSKADTESLAGAVRRFSTAALGAVAVVTATGVIMAWIVLPSVGELTSTGYGLALILKAALVVVVIALGAYNRYRLVPAVSKRSDEPGAAERRASARRWLGNIVLAELAVLVVAVGVTAVLVTRSPIGSTAAASAPAAEQGQSVTVELSNDAGTADVTVTPSSVGFNVIDIALRDVEGRVVNPYEAPVVELELPAADVGPLEPDVLPLAIGRYQATVNLGFAGTWELSVRVRIGEFESVAGSAALVIE
jgi:copper transport protein